MKSVKHDGGNYSTVGAKSIGVLDSIPNVLLSPTIRIGFH